MKGPRIGDNKFTIKFDEQWLTNKDILNPPLLMATKPFFYSDLKDKQIYVGWIEDGRYRRFGVDIKTFEFIRKEYKKFNLIP